MGELTPERKQADRLALRTAILKCAGRGRYPTETLQRSLQWFSDKRSAINRLSSASRKVMLDDLLRRVTKGQDTKEKFESELGRLAAEDEQEQDDWHSGIQGAAIIGASLGYGVCPGLVPVLSGLSLGAGVGACCRPLRGVTGGAWKITGGRWVIKKILKLKR